MIDLKPIDTLSKIILAIMILCSALFLTVVTCIIIAYILPS